MKTMNKLLAFGGLTLALVYSSLANATIIPPLVVDFRDSAWALAYGQNPFEHAGVTAEANDGLLYQDSRDGLGIMDSKCGYEMDEIDSCEVLTVSFAPEEYLISAVVISDLFDPEDGINDRRGEVGRLKYNTYSDDTVIETFWGRDSDQANGEQVIDLGVELDIKTIQFWVPKYDHDGDPETARVYREADEFSVIGFTGVRLPEPAPLVIFGLAIIGLAALRRK